MIPLSSEEAAIEVVGAPHPTPSPSDTGLLATLDWNPQPKPESVPAGWAMDSDIGWPNVAIDAGDLWALIGVMSTESQELVLLGPGGRHLKLMTLPEGTFSIAGWDHDAGLAYFSGWDGPFVVDLATYRWAFLPEDPAWQTGDGEMYQSAGTTSTGVPIWGVGHAMGTWDSQVGWRMTDVGGEWSQAASSRAPWFAFVGLDTVELFNALSQTFVELPGPSSEWDVGFDMVDVQWLDGDTIAKPPSGDAGWLAFDAPSFDTGRPVEASEFPLYRQDSYVAGQYPGTPLVAHVSDVPDEFGSVVSLGVLTTDGYRDLVDLTGDDAPCLGTYESPTELRRGIYAFDDCQGRGPFVVDVTTGDVFTYWIPDWQPFDTSAGDVYISYVIYAAPAESDGAAPSD